MKKIILSVVSILGSLGVSACLAASFNCTKASFMDPLSMDHLPCSLNHNGVDATFFKLEPELEPNRHFFSFHNYGNQEAQVMMVYYQNCESRTPSQVNLFSKIAAHSSVPVIVTTDCTWENPEKSSLSGSVHILLAIGDKDVEISRH